MITHLSTCCVESKGLILQEPIVTLRAEMTCSFANKYAALNFIRLMKTPVFKVSQAKLGY